MSTTLGGSLYQGEDGRCGGVIDRGEMSFESCSRAGIVSFMADWFCKGDEGGFSIAVEKFAVLFESESDSKPDSKSDSGVAVTFPLKMFLSADREFMFLVLRLFKLFSKSMLEHEEKAL